MAARQQGSRRISAFVAPKLKQNDIPSLSSTSTLSCKKEGRRKGYKKHQFYVFLEEESNTRAIGKSVYEGDVLEARGLRGLIGRTRGLRKSLLS